MAAAWGLPAKRKNLAWILTFLAALLFGFAVLARAPVILLLPGLLVLLWPVNLRSWYKTAGLAFILGVFVAGILPMAIHQSRVAGAWYLPTYAHENTAPPTLESVRPNISYYFGPGKSSTENWVFPAIFVGCLGLSFWSNRRREAQGTSALLRRPSWRRLIAAALLMLCLSTVYFLTHTATVHYYPWPAMFGAALLLGLGAFAVEDHSA